MARAVHAGKEPHLKDPEHADAAEAYAEQVRLAAVQPSVRRAAPDQNATTLESLLHDASLPSPRLPCPGVQVKKEGGHGQPASPKASHKPGELRWVLPHTATAGPAAAPAACAPSNPSCPCPPCPAAQLRREGGGEPPGARRQAGGGPAVCSGVGQRARVVLCNCARHRGQRRWTGAQGGCAAPAGLARATPHPPHWSVSLPTCSLPLQGHPRKLERANVSHSTAPP